MPKEWGNDKPNLSKFKKAIPKDHKELFEKLKKLAENWKLVDKCSVIKQMKAIVIDLGGAANFMGNPDFFIPIKPLKVDEADTLVKAVIIKVEKPAPLVEQDAINLFATIETAQ